MRCFPVREECLRYHSSERHQIPQKRDVPSFFFFFARALNADRNAERLRDLSRCWLLLLKKLYLLRMT